MAAAGYPLEVGRISGRPAENTALVLGPSGVGKTRLVYQTMFNRPPVYAEESSTIEFEYPPFVMGARTKVRVTEIGGNDHYRVLVQDKLADASLVILVFDASNPETIVDLCAYITTNIIEHRPVAILCANKIDLARRAWRDRLSTNQLACLDILTDEHRQVFSDVVYIETSCTEMAHSSTSRLRDVIACVFVESPGSAAGSGSESSPREGAPKCVVQ